MTTRNLSALFEPRSIALIGASSQPGSVGAILARNLASGGFPGRLMLVNPRLTTLDGAPCYPSVSTLPETPDLAVIATPARTIPEIVEDLARAGCRACIVISAGLAPEARQRMLSAARTNTMRIIGPNCLGFLSPGLGVNASFAQANASPGSLALVSQSGAIATAMLDWANGSGVGFSHIVSLGDMSDIDFGDLLDYLAMDRATSSILLYAENITSPRKFMSAARIAARAKPVIMVKAGRSQAGARAAASHTGALAGADAVYDAAIRRAGIMRVETLAQLFETAATLAAAQRTSVQPLTILTNGGGLGVLSADELDLSGGDLADVPAEVLARLDAVLPPAWSRGNPVDILGDAHGDRYSAALDILATQRPDGPILVANCPTGVADSSEAADAVIAARQRHPRLPMVACWMGEATAAPVRRRLFDAGIPAYDTPEAAVRAYQRMVEHGCTQRLLLEAPQASHIPDTADRAATAREIFGTAFAEGRSLLTEPESKRLLAAWGVPVVPTITVASPAEAKAAAAGLPAPFVLKILSRQITHKTDVGGVRLNLDTPETVEAAAADMLSRVAAAAPGAIIDGFTLQPMIRRPKAQELILGLSSDPTFGPCILFGHGGIAAETIADRAIGLPPLNDVLARDMISRTRVAKLLAGYRDRPPADLDGVVRVLLALSDMASELPDLAELDINPLLADSAGVIALDARVVVRKSGRQAGERMAIRPYPAGLRSEIRLADRTFVLRPILPEDAPRLTRLAAATDASDLRLRFHGALRELSPENASRLAQIDYDREMALVSEDGQGEVTAVGRLVFDPEFATAEIAMIVRSDQQEAGLGRTLLRSLLDYAFSRGASEVWGDILRHNTRALDLADHMEARRAPSPGGVELVRVIFSNPASGHRPG